MKIIWTRAALSDFDNILTHAQQRDAKEAANIVARIERTEKAICTFPKAAFYNQQHDYYERYVARTRVILIYQITAIDQVDMIAVFHTSRSERAKPS